MSKTVKNLSIYIAAQGEEEGTLRLYKEYDLEGKVITEVQYDDEGEAQVTKEITYDQNGNELEVKSIFDEENWESRKSEFDNLGRLSATWKELPNGMQTEKQIRSWNEAGDILTAQSLDEDGNIIGTEVYVHNSDQDLIEERYLDEEQNVIEQYRYEYDEAKRITRKVGEFGGFETIETFEYQVDAENRVLSRIRKDDEGDSDSLEITYHPNGNKASELQTAVDSAKIKFLYDEDEKVIREIRHDVTGYRIFEAANKYDEFGKLSERQVVNDNRLSFVMYDYVYFGEEEEE